jgi:hypothetical protein
MAVPSSRHPKEFRDRGMAVIPFTGRNRKRTHRLRQANLVAGKFGI